MASRFGCYNGDSSRYIYFIDDTSHSNCFGQINNQSVIR
jgi:hypothetical protein